MNGLKLDQADGGFTAFKWFYAGTRTILAVYIRILLCIYTYTEMIHGYTHRSRIHQYTYTLIYIYMDIHVHRDDGGECDVAHID